MIYGDMRLPERFWDKVMPVPYTGCWLWTAALINTGYGVFGVGKSLVLTHRLTASIEYTQHDEVVDHLCGERSCCNPDHLRWTTQKQNVLSGKRKTEQTHCLRNHALTGDNLLSGGIKRGRRDCMQCRRNRKNQLYAFSTYERAGNVR